MFRGRGKEEIDVGKGSAGLEGRETGDVETLGPP